MILHSSRAMPLSLEKTSLKRLPSFIKRQVFNAVIITWVFVASGLVITLLCVVAMVMIWPFSKSAYRRFVSKLASLLMGQLIWVSIDWADVQVTLFGDDDAYATIGKESSLITSSHLGDFDWLIGLMLADSHGFLETLRTLVKKSILFVPGFGQLLWALEYPFLDRNWSKDEAKIRKSLQAFKDYPFPIQVVIFCEGTRFTKEKYHKGIEYAKTAGLTPLKYHLVPRTKGYATVAHSLKHEAHFPTSYDIGLAYPEGQTYLNGDHMTFRDILAGQKLQIFLYLRCIPMDQVPSDTTEDLQNFCHNLYVHKDTAYHHFTQHGEYPYPSRPLVFSDQHVWFLRYNQMFWTLLVCVLPSCWLWWQILVAGLIKWAVVAVVGFIGLTILTHCMLAFSRPALGVSTQKKND